VSKEAQICFLIHILISTLDVVVTCSQTQDDVVQSFFLNKM